MAESEKTFDRQTPPDFPANPIYEIQSIPGACCPEPAARSLLPRAYKFPCNNTKKIWKYKMLED